MTIRPFVAGFFGFAALLAFANPAAAQTAGSGALSGSGSSPSPAERTPTERIESLKLLLEDREVRTREDLTEREDRLEQFMKDKTIFEKELALLREKCRSDIRKSNRDTKLPTTLSCYRADLTLQMAFLRKESVYIKQLGGLSAGARDKALAANKNASDAMATIVNAIDSDVYEDPAQVLSAKTKLWQQYQTARYLTLTLLRADRTLGWAGLMAQRIGQLWPMETQSDFVKNKILESLNCLEKTASITKSVEAASSYESTKILLGQYQSELGKCAEMLRAAVRSVKGISDPSLESGSGAVQAGSGTSNTTK